MTALICILVLLALILCNSFFSNYEASLIASRRARLGPLAADGDRRAALVLKMLDTPTSALSAIQVGITIIGIVSGIIGESALADPIAGILMFFGVSETASRAAGLVIAVMLITYFSIVLGELVPKRIGQMMPEDCAKRGSRVIQVLAAVMSPFVKLLAWTTNALLKKMFRGQVPEPSVTEEEIHAMIEQGSKTGVIAPEERDMVKNVFRLDDRQISSLMTPKSEIEWINLEDPQQENIDKILGSQRSRLVVADGSLDAVKGICSTRILMRQILHSGKPDFSAALADVSYVPETLTGMELLEHFRETDTPLSLVVNEYGEIQGLVTPRDVLEAIAGQFKPETNDDKWAVKRADGSWFLDGIIAVPDLKDRLGLRHVPEEEEERYSTLSGMMLLLLGKLPKEGDSVRWEGWTFEVADMDGRRIDKVLAIPDKR